MKAISTFLEAIIFPRVVAYIVFPLVILADILLFPLLVILKDQTTFVLLVNSYMNAGGLAITSILLLQDQLKSQQIQNLAQSHDALHEKLDTMMERQHEPTMDQRGTSESRAPLGPVQDPTPPPDSGSLSAQIATNGCADPFCHCHYATGSYTRR